MCKGAQIHQRGQVCWWWSFWPVLSCWSLRLVNENGDPEVHVCTWICLFRSCSQVGKRKMILDTTVCIYMHIIHIIVIFGAWQSWQLSELFESQQIQKAWLHSWRFVWSFYLAVFHVFLVFHDQIAAWISTWPKTSISSNQQIPKFERTKIQITSDVNAVILVQ